MAFALHLCLAGRRSGAGIESAQLHDDDSMTIILEKIPSCDIRRYEIVRIAHESRACPAFAFLMPISGKPRSVSPNGRPGFCLAEPMMGARTITPRTVVHLRAMRRMQPKQVAGETGACRFVVINKRG
jgi:hypothetical protein